jgi:hypothetical protein
MRGAGRFPAAILALTLLSPWVGCDEAFYAKGEIAAKKRFERVRVGDSEAAVRDLLGAPTCVVGPAGRGDDLEARCPEAAEPQRLERRVVGTWPRELHLMPSRSIEGKVLVYLDGTVAAHYYIDREGRVQDVRVVVS